MGTVRRESGAHEPEGGRYITLAEVAQCNTTQKLWIVLQGRVYDITAFLNEHPGGEEVLLEQGGKDATESFEDVGHSLDAREMLTQYLIGEVDPFDRQPECWYFLRAQKQLLCVAQELITSSWKGRLMQGKCVAESFAANVTGKGDTKTFGDLDTIEVIPVVPNKLPSNDSSLWTVWLIPIIGALVLGLMYRYYVMDGK